MATADINELLGEIPIGDIAARLGVDEATAKQAITQALPGLLGGMAVNASSEEGATKLTSALKKHEGAKFKGLDAVDTEDGQKIVQHVLGDKQQDVAMALGSQGEGGPRRSDSETAADPRSDCDGVSREAVWRGIADRAGRQLGRHR